MIPLPIPNAIPWLLCLLAACVGTPTAVGAAEAGGDLVVGEDQAPAHFNPIDPDDMYVVRAIELVYDGLLGYNRANQAGEPQLARSWRFDPALPGFVFELRGDVTWHDGKPFTSADVVFTVDLMREGQIWFRDFVASARAVGPHRVELRLARRPDEPADVLPELTFKILPRHALPTGATRISPTDPINAEPIGTGPYRYVERDGDRVLFERADGPRPRMALLDRIQLHAGADKDLQNDSLRGGLLSSVIRVRPKDVKVIEAAGKDLAVFEYDSLNWWFLAYNHRNPNVRNRAFRDALTRAIDREALRRAHLGDGWTISGPFAFLDMRNTPSIKPRPHDVAAAKAAFRKAGYTLRGDHLVGPRGRAVRLRLLVQPPLGQNPAMFTDLEAQLRAVGIGLQIDYAADIPSWRQRVRRGDGYDMVLGRWRPTPGDFLRPLFHSRGELNWFGYRNTTLDAQLDAYRNASDGESRRAALEALHRSLAADLPYTFLWSLKDFSAYRKRSYALLDLIHPFHYFSHVDHWYKKRAKR